MTEKVLLVDDEAEFTEALAERMTTRGLRVDVADSGHAALARAREVFYDAVILDPPTYGHGPGREVWKLQRDLEPLMRDCARLTQGRRRFMLVTCHTATYPAARLGRLLSDVLQADRGGPATARTLKVTSAAGGELPNGVVARWSCD